MKISKKIIAGVAGVAIIASLGYWIYEDKTNLIPTVQTYQYQCCYQDEAEHNLGEMLNTVFKNTKWTQDKSKNLVYFQGESRGYKIEIAFKINEDETCEVVKAETNLGVYDKDYLMSMISIEFEEMKEVK